MDQTLDRVRGSWHNGSSREKCGIDWRVPAASDRRVILIDAKRTRRTRRVFTAKTAVLRLVTAAGIFGYLFAKKNRTVSSIV
jgi:hypothetical protein